MPSLTHVYLWKNNHWEPITAREMIKMHPIGRVSAHSGLFMCSLCGQYVTFANGDVNEPHFRHLSREKSKSCPERTFGAGYQIYYDNTQYHLPFKMNLTGDSIFFEIGLTKVPKHYLHNDTYIEIIASGNSSVMFKYLLRERIDLDAVTYFSVGNIPAREYTLMVHNASKDIVWYWPVKVNGIDPEGTLFDMGSGKKLPYDADVVINRSYYLITSSRLFNSSYSGVRITDVNSINVRDWNLRIYRVEAYDYTKDAARFFLNYHCRLTDNPVGIQPIWPVYTDSPYLVKHNKDYMYFSVSGNAETHVFPTASVIGYPSEKGRVVRVKLNSRQQFISVGRTQVLKYKYYWQDPIKKHLPKPNIEIVDKQNNKLSSGVISHLPENGLIRFILPYDGMIIVKEKGIVKEKRIVKAEIQTTIYNISWGTNISVMIGIDCAWEASFEKKTVSHVQAETELLNQLCSCSGQSVAIPHSLGSLASHFKEYPKVRQWIYHCIRQRQMSEKALKLLKSYIVNGKVTLK